MGGFFGGGGGGGGINITNFGQASKQAGLLGISGVPGAIYGGYQGMRGKNASLGSILNGQPQSYQGVDMAMPDKPDFMSVNNHNGDLLNQYRMADKVKAMGSVPSLTDQYKQGLGGINPNTQGLEAMRTEATRTGPSAWMNSELARNQAELGQNLGNAATSNAGAAANARSSLASSHGLSGGAAERIAGNSAKSLGNQQQQMRSQSMLGNMNLASTDQSNRLNMLSQLPGQEMNLANFNLGKEQDILGQATREQGMNNQNKLYDTQSQNAAQGQDIANAMGDISGQNYYNQGNYQQGMGAYAANQQANAIGNSGQKGGLLGWMGVT